MGNNPDIEQLQKVHYDDIASQYAAHYGDVWSEKYRRRFIYEPLFENVNLSGAKVLDAMCGSGETTGYLLEKGAQITGVDISQKQIVQFQERFPMCNARCASILSTGLDSGIFDCAVVTGGLHHLHPKESNAIDEIHRLLKVGGDFCFMEPHSGSLPDQARRLWYGVDRLFAENEASLKIDELKTEFKSKFEFIKEEYKGNVAYLLVLNSLVFRVPLRLKSIYSKPLFGIEGLVEKIQGKRLSCFVICHWKKK